MKSAQYVYRNYGRDNSQFNLQQVHSPSKVLSQKGYLHILHSLSSLKHEAMQADGMFSKLSPLSNLIMPVV